MIWKCDADKVCFTTLLPWWTSFLRTSTVFFFVSITFPEHSFLLFKLKVSRLLSWTARTNCPLPPSSRFLLSPSTRIFGSRSGTFHGDLFGPQISGRRAPERHRSQRVKTLLSSFLLARLGLLGGCLSSPAEPNRRVFTGLLLLAGEACRCAGQRFVSHTVKHNSS